MLGCSRLAPAAPERPSHTPRLQALGSSRSLGTGRGGGSGVAAADWADRHRAAGTGGSGRSGGMALRRRRCRCVLKAGVYALGHADGARPIGAALANQMLGPFDLGRGVWPCLPSRSRSRCHRPLTLHWQPQPLGGSRASTKGCRAPAPARQRPHAGLAGALPSRCARIASTARAAAAPSGQQQSWC
jgi:hypothetical protein